MPRLRHRLLSLVAVITAALVSRAAVVSVVQAGSCLSVHSDAFTQAVEAADVIVIGTIVRSLPEAYRGVAVMEPEAFLKGAARPGTIELTIPDPRPRCPLAALDDGARLLVLLESGDEGLEWPGAEQAFVLSGGEARQQGLAAPSLHLPEVQLVRNIRAITGQYATPPTGNDEGAAIHWRGTLLPVGAAVAVIFIIALFLMRIWHRIDPS